MCIVSSQSDPQLWKYNVFSEIPEQKIDSRWSEIDYIHLLGIYRLFLSKESFYDVLFQYHPVHVNFH